jgi:hypothetical protein
MQHLRYTPDNPKQPETDIECISKSVSGGPHLLGHQAAEIMEIDSWTDTVMETVEAGTATPEVVVI